MTRRAGEGGSCSGGDGEEEQLSLAPIMAGSRAGAKALRQLPVSVAFNDERLAGRHCGNQASCTQEERSVNQTHGERGTERGADGDGETQGRGELGRNHDERAGVELSP